MQSTYQEMPLLPTSTLHALAPTLYTSRQCQAPVATASPTPAITELSKDGEGGQDQEEEPPAPPRAPGYHNDLSVVKNACVAAAERRFSHAEEAGSPEEKPLALEPRRHASEEDRAWT